MLTAPAEIGGCTSRAAVASYSFVACERLTAVPTTGPEIVKRTMSHNRRRMAEMMNDSSTGVGRSSLAGKQRSAVPIGPLWPKLSQRYAPPAAHVRRGAPMVEQIEQYGNPEGMSLLALVQEDYAANGRDWTAPGFRALFVHRFGNWRMSVEPKVLRAPLSLLYRSMARFVRNHYGIEMPFAVRVGR